MNYDLALKLKTAGFPQELENGNWAYCLDCGETSDLHLMHDDNDEGNFVGNDYGHRFKDFPEDNWIKVPTLSELIDACGDRFFKLVKVDVEEYLKFGNWHAYSTEEDDCYGKTPEEAVVNLYLALKKVIDNVGKENNKIVTREKCQDGSCDSCQRGDGYQCKYRQH